MKMAGKYCPGRRATANRPKENSNDKQVAEVAVSRECPGLCRHESRQPQARPEPRSGSVLPFGAAATSEISGRSPLFDDDDLGCDPVEPYRVNVTAFVAASVCLVLAFYLVVGATELALVAWKAVIDW